MKLMISANDNDFPVVHQHMGIVSKLLDLLKQACFTRHNNHMRTPSAIKKTKKDILSIKRTIRQSTAVLESMIPTSPQLITIVEGIGATIKCLEETGDWAATLPLSQHHATLGFGLVRETDQSSLEMPKKATPALHRMKEAIDELNANVPVNPFPPPQRIHPKMQEQAINHRPSKVKAEVTAA